MKSLSLVFNLPSIFFFAAAIIYGILTGFQEWVGFPAILLTGAMFVWIGYYFRMLDKRHAALPEDDKSGEVSDHAGDYGKYAPWSWWPLVLGLGCALMFLALAVGWWFLAPAAVVAVIGLVGWVMEYSTGLHAH